MDNVVVDMHHRVDNVVVGNVAAMDVEVAVVLFLWFVCFCAF